MKHGLPTDARVAGRFRVVHHLGAGGMGDVYKAVDERDGALVALKVVSGRARDAAIASERLLREGAAGARIEHPGVVRVLDVGLDDGRAYVAMELLEGEDLGTRLEREGSLSIAQVTALARELCDALGALHAAGVVHRDLKPRNLFLARDASGAERLKVLDFGLAKLTFLGDSLTQAEQVFGTLLYLSPEQLRGARYADVRSDLWAAGTILYEALAGRAAFSGDSAPEIIQQITSTTPARVETLRPELPRALALLVWRAMQPDPALRFQSAQAMRAALDPAATEGALPRPDALTQSLTHVLPRAPAATLHPPARRFKLPALALAGLVVLLQAAVPLRPAAGTSAGAATAPEVRSAKGSSSMAEPHNESAARTAGLAHARSADAPPPSTTASTRVGGTAPAKPVGRAQRKRRAPEVAAAKVAPPAAAPVVLGAAGEIKRSEF